MVIPEFISLVDWADNLFVDYPHQNLPILLEEKNWKEWAEILVGTGSFAQRQCPPPQEDDWKLWALTVYIIMTVPLKKLGELPK